MNMDTGDRFGGGASVIPEWSEGIAVAMDDDEVVDGNDRTQGETKGSLSQN